MKCPFVERACLERECIGWANGRCFVESLNLKIDTICNLISKVALEVDLPNKTLHLNQGGEHIDLKSGSEEELISTIEQVEEKKVQPHEWEQIKIPEDAADAILAVDFGTSLSKVAIKTMGEQESHPIPIGKISKNILFKDNLIDSTEEGKDFVEDSFIFIDDDKKIFCGTLARHKFLKSSGIIKPILNLKKFLISGGVDHGIDSHHFPEGVSLTIKEVLGTYLAYLFHLGRQSIGADVKININIEGILRNFSIPVWEDKEYRQKVIQLMKDAIANAYCIEHWFKEDLIKGVQISILKQAFEEAQKYQQQAKKLFNVEVTEPVAAAFSLIKGIPVVPGRPYNLYVIDIGAGSADFALLTITESTNFLHKQGFADKGVSAWDNGLRYLLQSKVKEKYGLPEHDPDYIIFCRNLDISLMREKEKVIASGDGYPINVWPASTNLVMITRDELDNTEPVKETLNEIRKQFIEFIKQTINILGSKAPSQEDPSNAGFYITGGGSFIPSIVNCIKECTGIIGPSFPSRVIVGFIPPEYASNDSIATDYPMLAVSLGATEPMYPPEKPMPPLTVDPGEHEIGKFRIKGV